MTAERDPYDPETGAAETDELKAKLEADRSYARAVLEARRGAYYRVFVEGVPSLDDRKLVLEDLQRFCRHGMTAYHDNERTHCLLTGRQEVALRIDDFTRLNVDTLVIKYAAV